MKFSRKAPSHIMNDELVLNSFEKKFIEMPERIGNMNQHMFREDFGNIFFGSTRMNAAIFNIISNNDEVQENLLLSFTRVARHSRDEYVFQEVLEEIIQSLLYYGKAAYLFHSEQSEEQVIRSLPPNTVFSLFGVLFQYLPKRIMRNWNEDDEQLGREIRLLNRDNVLFFNWPKSVRKKIQSQNRILKALDKYAFDGANKHFVQPTHENPNPKNYFDFTVWRDARDEALFEATKFTGWSGRDTSFPNKSDFFICHRLIRFRKLQIEACVHILNSLSEQLTSIGKLHSPKFEMRISFSEEYPSLSKFDELEKRLESEEANFGEVLDYCYQKG